jgi:endonuclease G, mitochondrial
MVNRLSDRRYLSAVMLAVILSLISLAGVACRRSNTSQPAPPQPAAAAILPHLPFGNPSDAGSDPNNRLVLRQQFAASWNASTRTANWVAWRLTASDIGDTERSQFYHDPEIDTPAPSDYTRSGYDRGHLCPSKDRSDTPENNRGVFTMLNIFPQAPDNNRGPWEKFERAERALAQSGREVYIVAGGVDSQTSFNGITVPQATWKVVVALGRGKAFPEGQEEAQVFAVLMPNRNGIKDDRWQQYQTTVAEIEQKTGYHFFKLSPMIEGTAEKMR